ncbi:septal ring lytic transglycosylase RlpA family protein [Nonomuraea pusilla]|uniref:Probable endolytic peptidoglycan transglycosylase RlpA n=1 Tax=Nonomuraea pusilla TaxID=46177 RepID=A0A1H7Z3L9_9ACTN|nr:septal ring lytic transglycosylase RlpA family protein [Nonomuraea pusilla]SEM52916.1 rare lipoprotein A [Nonomuraea pusilla]
MGQHSRHPSPQPFPDDREGGQNPHDAKPAPSRRRWTAAVAAGAAVVAAVSTTAWAVTADDAPTSAAAVNLPPNPAAPASSSPKPGVSSPAPSPAAPSSVAEAAQQGNPDPSPSAAPKPPAGAEPKSSASPRPSHRRIETVARPKKKTVAAKTQARVVSSGSCGASYYDEPQMTASGERFDPSAMTAAHKTLPLGSRVRVINPNSGASVIVRINDRGPYVGGRCLDLSRAAFSAIGSVGAGVMTVKYQVLAR